MNTEPGLLEAGVGVNGERKPWEFYFQKRYRGAGPQRVARGQAGPPG